jgi:hypothetical protein
VVPTGWLSLSPSLLCPWFFIFFYCWFYELLYFQPINSFTAKIKQFLFLVTKSFIFMLLDSKCFELSSYLLSSCWMIMWLSHFALCLNVFCSIPDFISYRQKGRNTSFYEILINIFYNTYVL